MPPKTQSFALPLQKRDSPDKCMEHLDVPSWSEAWEPLNWAVVDSLTCLVNGVMVFGAFMDVVCKMLEVSHTERPVSLECATFM